MKLVPILGTIVLVGAILQVILGTQVAGGAQDLFGVHLIFGLVGLFLVVGLSVVALRGRAASVYSKAIMIIITLMVFLQVAMGFQILGGIESFKTMHEANGYLIVLLSFVMGGVTMMSARRQARSVA